MSGLAGLLIAFAAVALVAGMIVFVGATQSTQVIDSQGNTSTAAGNATNLIVQNVTAVGGTSTGLVLFVIAALVVIAGVGLLVMYGKTK